MLKWKQKTPAVQKCLVCLCLATVVFFALLSALPVSADLALYDRMVRLHVLANSDSAEDQELKLQVRDAVLAVVAEETAACENIGEINAALAAAAPRIEAAARRVIAQTGHDYPVCLTLTDEYYPTRSYEGFSLPAGNYRSLRVLIGEAAGHNWWCVLFPPLCVNMATVSTEGIQATICDSQTVGETLTAVGFTPDEIRVLTGDDDPHYVLRFRLLELLGEFGHRLFG